MEGGVSSISFTNETADQTVRSRQTIIRAAIDRAQSAIGKAHDMLASSTGTSSANLVAAKAELRLAESNTNMVLLDGSMGFHNFTKATTLLEEAKTKADHAIQLLSK